MAAARRGRAGDNVHRRNAAVDSRGTMAGTMPFARRTLLLAFAAACGARAAAPAALPRNARVPGGVARIALGAATQRPAAQQGELPLLVVGDASGWSALVG